MATEYSFGKIVTNGLVLCLDAADRNSYVSGSTVWRDVAGSNNGTLTNGPTFNTGSGGSIVFDGTNDYVGCGDILDLTNNLSIGIWCNFSSIDGTQNIFAKPSQYWIHKEITVNKFRFKIETPTRYEVEANLSLTTNQWYYVVGTYDNISIKIYINGIYYNATNVTGNIQNTSNSLNLGAWQSGADPFNGRLSIGQIYNRALTPSEILQNYNAQKSRFGL